MPARIPRPSLRRDGPVRFSPLLLIAAASLVAVGACASSGENEATGIVVGVEGELEDVEGFTVLVDGEQMEFETIPEGDYAFPLGHLQDHLRSGEPVLIRWEEQGDSLIATFIADG
ncbi:MAG: hypothetical protein ACLFWM_04375 [Actinomycetota bacterium]